MAYDENGHEVTTYNNSAAKYGRGKAKTDTIWAFAAVGNHVYTGAGDDYVAQLVNYKDEIFSVDMGEEDNDNDKFMLGNADYYYDEYSDLTANQQARVTGAEMKRSVHETGTEIDGLDGWANQVGKSIYKQTNPNAADEGGCLLYSLINYLGKCTNKANLNEYVEIIDNKNNTYTVTFKKYEPSSGLESDKTITFSRSELRLAGDLDSAALVTAVRLIVNRNYSNLSSANISTIANYHKDIVANLFFGKTNPNIVKTFTVISEIWNPSYGTKRRYIELCISLSCK